MATTLDELADLLRTGLHQRVFVSMDTALAGIPVVILNHEESNLIAHGRRIERTEGPKGEESLVRIHNSTGVLVALARTGRGELRPELVFS
jgi:tRNA U55 pseudouridine synthase TruB